MGTTLHIFKDYKCIAEYEQEEIVYENDLDKGITYSTSASIMKLLSYISFITEKDIYIRVYDYYDDAHLAKTRQLDIMNPIEFASILREAMPHLKTLDTTKNTEFTFCNYKDTLFDEDASHNDTYEKQKEAYLEYAQELLKWAEEGYYFVFEKD